MTHDQSYYIRCEINLIGESGRVVGEKERFTLWCLYYLFYPPSSFGHRSAQVSVSWAGALRAETPQPTRLAGLGDMKVAVVLFINTSQKTQDALGIF